MSHKATNWAVTIRGIKAGAKVVLWHLADCHNPQNGCFPSLEYLSHHAEVSLSQVKVHLNDMEARGLIKRVRMKDEDTRKQLSTRYFLAFEDGFESVESNDPPGPSRDENDAKPGPESGPGTGADSDEKPGPDSGESRGRIPAPNPVKESCKGTGRAKRADAPDGSSRSRSKNEPPTMTPEEMVDFYQVTMLIDFITGAGYYDSVVRGAGFDHHLTERELDDIVLAMDDGCAPKKRVVGLIDWARKCVEREPETKLPIAQVKRIIRAILQPDSRAETLFRISKLIGEKFEIDLPEDVIERKA